MIQTIPVSKIVFSASNPRKKIDQAKITELAESIKSIGLLQAPLVRPLQDPNDDILGNRFEVVFGERRIRACVEAGLSEVDCSVREMPDDEADEARAIENAQRENISTLEEADNVAALMATSRYKTQQAIADKLGKSRRWVAIRIAVASMPSLVRDLIESEKITPAHAEVLARITDPVRQSELAVYAAEDGDSVSDLSAFVAREFRNLARVPWELDEKYGDCAPCSSCMRRSQRQADLFPESAEADDNCLDRKCWDLKMSAYRESIESELIEQGCVKYMGEFWDLDENAGDSWTRSKEWISNDRAMMCPALLTKQRESLRKVRMWYAIYPDSRYILQYKVEEIPASILVVLRDHFDPLREVVVGEVVVETEDTEPEDDSEQDAKAAANKARAIEEEKHSLLVDRIVAKAGDLETIIRYVATAAEKTGKFGTTHELRLLLGEGENFVESVIPQAKIKRAIVAWVAEVLTGEGDLLESMAKYLCVRTNDLDKVARNKVEEKEKATAF